MVIDLIYKYLQFFVKWFAIIKHRWNDKKLKQHFVVTVFNILKWWKHVLIVPFPWLLVCNQFSDLVIFYKYIFKH